MTKISFGDNVEVRSAPETTQLGIAGFKGSVYGETTPSVSGVSVIGKLQNDFALNVHLPDAGKAFWFAPELLAFVDHAPGTVVTIGNATVTRAADGSWTESKKPWW